MNSDPEIIGWRTIIDEHESLQALRICAIIQVDIRVFLYEKNFKLFSSSWLPFLALAVSIDSGGKLTIMQDNQRTGSQLESTWVF